MNLFHSILTAMAFFMLAGSHFADYGMGIGSMAMWAALAVVAVLEVNAVVGKQGPMTTVRGVIVSSLVLTAIIIGILVFV